MVARYFPVVKVLGSSPKEVELFFCCFFGKFPVCYLFTFRSAFCLLSPLIFLSILPFLPLSLTSAIFSLSPPPTFIEIYLLSLIQPARARNMASAGS